MSKSFLTAIFLTAILSVNICLANSSIPQEPDESGQKFCHSYQNYPYGVWEATKIHCAGGKESEVKKLVMKLYQTGGFWGLALAELTFKNEKQFVYWDDVFRLVDTNSNKGRFSFGSPVYYPISYKWAEKDVLKLEWDSDFYIRFITSKVCKSGKVKVNLKRIKPGPLCAQ